MPSAHTEQHIRDAVACPICGAPQGQACRQGLYIHDPRRGIEDLTPWLKRCHNERRAEWQEWKRKEPQP